MSDWSEWTWMAALLFGLLLGWLVEMLRQRLRRRPDLEAFEALKQELSASAQARAGLEERARGLESALQESKNAEREQRDESTGLHRRLAAADERVRSLEARLQEQKKELEQMHQKLAVEFEALANRALEANSEKFVARNRESLDKLLLPLSEKIAAFRERVEKTHDQSIKDRAALVEQLRALGDLNQRISEEARNLTTALKGQTKTQGNWGELILETVLEKSGLVAGQEYEVQASLKGEDGRRYQPDVLIKLPEGKHLVVDAKVSLIAYERCVNCDDGPGRELALREHLQSLKGHIGELSRKRYDALYEIKSPDFTLMFIPIEPAFSLAMGADDTLFDFAFRQNVVLVTPSTLLATLRTVANIWRQEKQNRNALEIAQRSGALYDKFVGFFEDMERIGEQIKRSGEAYDSAMGKLRSGRGNLINQVQMLKDLGAKAKKALPEAAVELAREELVLED